MSGGERKLLVVANETLAGDELVDAVRARAAEGPIRAIVVAPVNEPRAARVVYENSRRASAGRRLDRTVAQLRQEGIPAYGDVFEGGPLTAVEDALALAQYRARQSGGTLVDMPHEDVRALQGLDNAS